MRTIARRNAEDRLALFRNAAALSACPPPSRRRTSWSAGCSTIYSTAAPGRTPSAPRSISPYAASVYASLFEEPATIVPTVLPEQSFWEKASILHREAMRAESGAVPARYSRHYYDLWCMAEAGVAARALAQPDLLARGVRFKEKFYRCPWARYDLAERPSGLRLVPKPVHAAALVADYDHMRNMIFGPVPDFGDILAQIGRLQATWAMSD